MIPAILAAMKAATWAQRGISAGVITGVLAAVFAWGYLKGIHSCERSTAQEVLDQALAVGKHEAKKSETLAKVEEQHDAKERQSDQQTKVVTHEIVRYVQVSKPIELDPEYRRLVDQLHQLQRDAENRVSPADPSPIEVAAVRAATITTNQLLLAYTDLANARRKDLELIEYMQAFEKARYEGEMAFYSGLPATARSEE